MVVINGVRGIADRQCPCATVRSCHQNVRAARRDRDVVGDELLDAEAVRVPHRLRCVAGVRGVPDADAFCEPELVGDDRVKHHVGVAHVALNCVTRREPRDVGCYAKSHAARPPYWANPGRSTVGADHQVAGVPSPDDARRVERISSDRDQRDGRVSSVAPRRAVPLVDRARPVGHVVDAV